MNDSLKVQTHHLKRQAYLYIRQSSMKQVMENTESTKRLYALRQRANALGCPIDNPPFNLIRIPIVADHVGWVMAGLPKVHVLL